MAPLVTPAASTICCTEVLAYPWVENRSTAARVMSSTTLEVAMGRCLSFLFGLLADGDGTRAAVDGERMTGDPRGVVGEQERDRPGDVLGLADATQRVDRRER